MNNTWSQFTYANITGVYDMARYANSVTDNFFGTGLMMGVFMIMYLLFRSRGDVEGFTAAGFISLLLGSMLWWAGLVGDLVMVVFLAVTAIGAFLTYTSRK